MKDFSLFLPGCKSMLSHVHTCCHSFGSICFKLVIQNRNSQIERLGQKLMKRIIVEISELNDPGTSPRPDSGRTRAWVCVFPVLCEHTEHWAGGALCSLVFSYSWPLALALTACFFLQSRLLEATALLYSLCRVPGTVRPWPWPGPLSGNEAHWRNVSLPSGTSKQPPAISEGLASVHGVDGISRRVWVWTQTPPLGADTVRGWQNPERVVQVSVLTGCVLDTGPPAVVSVQLRQWQVFLSKWTPKDISPKGRVTYWNTCQTVQPREIVLLFTSRETVDSREEKQVLSDFSSLWHIFHILSHSAVFCSPGIWGFFPSTGLLSPGFHRIVDER